MKTEGNFDPGDIDTSNLSPVRTAAEAREAHHEKNARWVAPEQIVGSSNPHALEAALRSGLVRVRFAHSSRWWIWKEASPREAIRLGATGASLVDSEHWLLRVSRADWLEFAKPAAAPAPLPASLQPAEGLSQPAAPVAPELAPAAAIEAAPGSALKRNNAGAPVRHAWGEADRYATELLDDLGDPHDPLAAKEGWRSDADLAERVAEHLGNFDPDHEPPDSKTVARKLRPLLKKRREQ
jgi:hypothetical protein